MTNYLRRARSALHELLRGRPGPPPDSPRSSASSAGTAAESILLGNGLVIDAGGLSFVDAAQSAANPLSWLDAFEAGLAQNARLSDSAVNMLRSSALAADRLLPDADSTQRLLALLRPRPGLSARLGDLLRAGIL